MHPWNILGRSGSLESMKKKNERTNPSEKKTNIGKANEKSDEELYKKEREFQLSSKFPTDTITVRDNNNDTRYAIACSLEAARLVSKLIPQLQRCKPRKAYETNKGKLILEENQRASTG